MELILIFWALCGILGAMISSGKNRGAGEGGCLGFILGPIGLLIAILMPSQAATQQVVYVAAGQPVPPPAPAPRAARDPDEIERERQAADAQRLASEAEERRVQAQIKKLAIEAEIRRDVRRQRRGEVIAHVASFAWFRAWPDWIQAVSAGLALAVVALAILVIGIRMFS